MKDDGDSVWKRNKRLTIFVPRIGSYGFLSHDYYISSPGLERCHASALLSSVLPRTGRGAVSGGVGR